MDASTAILGFTLTALLLTLTPGLDTALVLRTAAVEGGRKAMRAGGGIVTGVLIWGLIAALGLGAVLAVSRLAYTLLQIAGAAYLLWLGWKLISGALKSRPTLPADDPPLVRGERWFLRGLLTNLLNPKVGVFYVSLLPQFVPADVPVVGFSVLLAGIHAAMGLLWFAALVLATRSLARWLRRPTVMRSLDALTGLALMGFGLRLALSRPTN
ncbi:LysE family translocator [Pseudomonas aeruginosa]|uniref:LysE family translocator n=1 Tax=Pseudomonas aeruginosa TaxID=287 RepID=UPI001ADC2B8F|nr:LysE family translocator [Pseudomonas aeruginosa]MBO8369672.1 LysE family translocator [Pseudomonas aeruginosa]